MKKTLLLVSAFAMVLMTACNKELTQPENVVVNPSPLELKGGMIEATIKGTFPEKKFVKKGILVVTPVLKYKGQETLGESVTYVGEKAKVNGKVVNYKKGGAYKQDFKCKFVPEMAKSELFLRFTAIVNKDTLEIPELKIADGVLATELLAMPMSSDVSITNMGMLRPVDGDATSTFAAQSGTIGQMTPDMYQRIIQETQEADIKFLIQQANLRSSETRSAEMKAFRAAIKAANDSANTEINNIEIAGYASPDGKTNLNQGLAEKRQAVAEKFLARQLKRDKVNATIESNITAEDWEGFQALMESSNIKDKELVLRVLSMYTDPEEREAQIKNLAAVYSTIADEILPELRRARLILTTDIIGYSDEEILNLAANTPDVLSLDELLYAAAISQTVENKKDIYSKVTVLHPNDYRAFNNIGLIYFQENNLQAAGRSFEKALAIQPKNADVNYNAGLVALAIGDLDKAGQYLGKAAGTNADLNSAMGAYYTLRGEYKKAAQAYGQTPSNAAAVQQILNKDYAAARKTLAAIANPNGTTAYLAAIVGARTNDRNAVYENLRKAIEKCETCKEKAANDIEFAKFADDATFLSIVK